MLVERYEPRIDVTFDDRGAKAPFPHAAPVPVASGTTVQGLMDVRSIYRGADADDMRRSLELGEIVPVPKDAPPTLCDALQTPLVSPITFGILKKRGANAVAVSEDDVLEAVRFAWAQHGLVVEPGGAAALAALLSGKVEAAAGTVAIVSGGNVDPALHTRIVSGN